MFKEMDGVNPFVEQTHMSRGSVQLYWDTHARGSRSHLQMFLTFFASNTVGRYMKVSSINLLGT